MTRQRKRQPARDPKPGTVAHFRRWARELVLDTGEPFEPQRFELEIVRDVLSAPRTWAVLPEGNGKTTLNAAVALYHLDPDGWGIRLPMVVVAAATREQAEWLYQQAENFVLDSPALRGRFICQRGFRRIRLPADSDDEPRGRIQVFAADDKTADGAIFTLAIVDELHNHRDLRLYRRWNGKLRKRGAQMVAISTAGEPSSEFEEQRAKIIREGTVTTSRGAHRRVEGANGLVLHDWAIRDRELADSFVEVKRANPLKAITVKTLREDRADPAMTEAHWLRFKCNLAAREEGQGILDSDWDACAEPELEPDLSAWSIGWLDVGWRMDTTAMGVLVWEAQDRRVVAGVTVLEPPVSERELVESMLDLNDDFGPVDWVYDPNAGAQQVVQQLEAGEHLAQGPTRRQISFRSHSQEPSAMARAAVRLDEAIRARWLVHDGDPVLRRHVLNAVRKQMPGEKWRFERPARHRRSRYPIDALTGLLMGHSVAVAIRGEALAADQYRIETV